jgi:hypothetical protein
MAPVLIAILSLTVLGIPFVLAVDREAPPLRLLGLACLYGTGVIYFVLLALSVLHVRWTLVSVTIAAIFVTVPFIRRLSTQHAALSTVFMSVPIASISSSTWSPAARKRSSSSPHPVPTVPEPMRSPGESERQREANAIICGKV